MSPTITTPAMTQAGMILGTAAYMSPEQARGKPVDKRADIWAFGVRAVRNGTAGKRAFRGEDVTTRSGDGHQGAGLERAAGATPAGVRLLRRCLKKTAKARMRDIGEARLEIEDLVAAERRTMRWPSARRHWGGEPPMRSSAPRP